MHGKIEFITNYKRNKKYSYITYYYPNGTVYGEVNFKKDSLNGKSIWYGSDSSTMQESTYLKGKKIDTSTYYASKDKILFRDIYDKHGVPFIAQFFQGFDKRYLWQETFFNKGKRAKSIYHNEDGTIKTIAYYYKNNYNTQAEEEYDSSGKLIKKRYWDENGKLIKVESF